ncbi:MAG: hypothetical protein JWQ97_3201, partial [Phenylobacterium sp.]|nr:hypothetical protein [Phenylobacterium sp.]
HAYAKIGVDMTVFNVFPGLTGIQEVERNMRYLAEHVMPQYRAVA